jgi:anti-sigma factor RsiW
MSLSSDTMMKLMAYADGELEGAELVEAQKLLASDPDSVRFVEQIAGLGEIVTRGYDAGAGTTTAKFDVADAVMSRVAPVMNGTHATHAKNDANVSSLAAARAKRGSSMKVGAGIAAALALAASVFLFAQHRSDEAPMASAVAPVSVAPANGVVATNGGTGVSVSTVNSPGEAVSVFYLPTANELSTSVVVWVDETGEK